MKYIVLAFTFVMTCLWASTLFPHQAHAGNGWAPFVGGFIAGEMLAHRAPPPAYYYYRPRVQVVTTCTWSDGHVTVGPCPQPVPNYNPAYGERQGYFYGAPGSGTANTAACPPNQVTWGWNPPYNCGVGHAYITNSNGQR